MNTSLQSALDHIGEYFGPSPSRDDQFLMAKCMGMMRAYDTHWREDNSLYDVIAVEDTLIAPLINLRTQQLTSYLVGGKRDVLLREKRGGKIVLMDHKNLYTAFDSEDIEHLHIAGQPNVYAYLGMTKGVKADYALWDICVKSLHKPKKESSRLVSAAKEERIKKGKIITPAKPERVHKRTRVIIPAQDEIREPDEIIPASREVRETTPAETPDEFKKRIESIYLEEASKYMARPIIPLKIERITNNMLSFYEWSKRLAQDKVFPSNPDACFHYNRPCHYLGLCSGMSRVDDGTWTRVSQPHAELEVPADVNPFKIITGSRLSMYKLCPLKHDRWYNQGLRKIGKEEDLALRIGTAMHLGFEHYYRAAL